MFKVGDILYSKPGIFIADHTILIVEINIVINYMHTDSLVKDWNTNAWIEYYYYKINFYNQLWNTILDK